MHECVLVCVHLCRSQRTTLGIIPWTLSTFFFETDSLTLTWA